MRSALARKSAQKVVFLHRTIGVRSARKAPWPRVPVVHVVFHAERMKSQLLSSSNTWHLGRTNEMYNGGPVAARGRTVLRITPFGISIHHGDSAPLCMRDVQVSRLGRSGPVRSVCCLPASPGVTYLLENVGTR